MPSKKLDQFKRYYHRLPAFVFQVYLAYKSAYKHILGIRSDTSISTNASGQQMLQRKHLRALSVYLS